MAAILPFPFVVISKFFLPQAQSHVCVHLHPCAYTRVHDYRYWSRYVRVQHVVTGFSMAAILFCAFLLFFNFIDQIFVLDFR